VSHQLLFQILIKNVVVFFFFFETVSCYVAKAGLELETLLSQPPKYWDYNVCHHAPLEHTYGIHTPQTNISQSLEFLEMLRHGLGTA
jgi:hypothetical protein